MLKMQKNDFKVRLNWVVVKVTNLNKKLKTSKTRKIFNKSLKYSLNLSFN